MRVDANVSVRHVGASELGTRCEIKNVNSLAVARSRHRVRGTPPGRPARGGRAGASRRPATGTRTVAAPAPGGRRRRPRTTGTSRSPTSCRSSPNAEWVAEIDRSLPALPGRAPRRARRRWPVWRRPTVALAVDRDLDGLAMPGDRRRWRPATRAHPHRAQPRGRRRRRRRPAHLARADRARGRR